MSVYLSGIFRTHLYASEKEKKKKQPCTGLLSKEIYNWMNFAAKDKVHLHTYQLANNHLRGSPCAPHPNILLLHCCNAHPNLCFCDKHNWISVRLKVNRVCYSCLGAGGWNDIWSQNQRTLRCYSNDKADAECLIFLMKSIVIQVD